MSKSKKRKKDTPLKEFLVSYNLKGKTDIEETVIIAKSSIGAMKKVAEGYDIDPSFQIGVQKLNKKGKLYHVQIDKKTKYGNKKVKVLDSKDWVVE